MNHFIDFYSGLVAGTLLLLAAIIVWWIMKKVNNPIVSTECKKVIAFFLMGALLVYLWAVSRFP